MNKTSKSTHALTEKQFILYGLNYVIGFGFIATISKVINIGVWGILVFVLTSLITLAVIFAFARAGNRYKNEVGGSYAYAKKTFGKHMSFFQGWNQASQMILFSATTPLFLSRLLTNIDPNRSVLYIILSLVLYIGFILLGTFGLKSSKKFILLTAIIKWLTLGGGFALIIYIIATSGSYGDTFRNIAPISVSALASTVLSFIYAYGGFEALATISKEVGTTRFKKTMIFMFLIVIFSYFIFYIIFIGISQKELGSFNLEFVYKFVWGITGFAIFSVGITFNRISGILGNIAPQARIIAALSNDGFLPHKLAYLNKHNEYSRAVITYALVGTISSLVFTIIPTALGVKDTFGKILDSGNIAFLIQYFLTIITVLTWAYRKEEKIPLWEQIIYYIGLIAIAFTLIFSQIIIVGQQKLSIEQFLPLIAYISVMLLGYIVWFLVNLFDHKSKELNNQLNKKVKK
ncbi:amino acid transporter [Mesomycoplasma conjunctivae]|uniref:Amino acid permease n=1 Tax=Mesomycoplasma conjunctivae (strain ATCC 25834 / NCTC 10147 / HRC/581) TaxID=572263 RepID=C5J712_MESCH|nr:APC family permease [Mesomycoplasma conjunctivae]CAT05275.1 Amino acid permease [Mesomycoplasma conjunctivae]VEU66505.1 amino acid transporter [Mesomycoplasma conjunctivae]